MKNNLLSHIQASQRPQYTKPLKIRGSILWLSDIEIPFHNADFLNRCIDLAKRYRVRQCVWGGDFCHFEAFSPFTGADTDAEKEINEIDEYLPQFLEPFEKIYWIMGNHDDRAMRALQRKIKADQALRMVIHPDTAQEFRRKVTLSEYYWAQLGKDWLLEHAKNNSVIPTRIAQRLAEKYQKNVVMGHTHKWGITHDISGKFICIESGCGVDIERLAYTNLRHSTHTQMVNGAVILHERNGSYVPQLLSPLITDWEFELWCAKKQSR